LVWGGANFEPKFVEAEKKIRLQQAFSTDQI